MADSDDKTPDGAASPNPPYVDVYWRPGCGFCMTLLRGLHKANLPVREVNIWDDSEAAAFVRKHANGNETVPTVDINGAVLVNPSAKVVLAMASDAGLPSEQPDSWWRRSS